MVTVLYKQLIDLTIFYSRARTPADSMEDKTQDDAIWGLEDYAIYVPMTDAFYQTLKFRRVTREQVDSGTYEPQPRYADSRSYMRLLVRHLLEYSASPAVFDVGGYIGRFSIETALLFRELGVDAPITCFEPGGTYEMLARNLQLNKMAGQVNLVRSAVSKSTGEVTFAIPPDAMISSRIVGEDGAGGSPAWATHTVAAGSLSTYLKESGNSRPFICKIDTEGHEADVIEGIDEQTLAGVPHALIVEYWPVLREKRIHGKAFEPFLFENYVVFDIRNSLYPAGYHKLVDLNDISERVSRREINNVDLLLIRKNTPHLQALLEGIEGLAVQ